jgi:ABC-2 type transport system ATP-binding protein
MLEAIGLTKRYGDIRAVDDCTFQVPAGRIVGFLGPNGAGKTTTMRCIFGLVRLDAGDVRWDGREVSDAQRLRFGYMPEERGLYPRMRLGEQLAYFARLSGLEHGDAEGASSRWLERLGLADRVDDRLEELSHGNQQRMQLATALVHDPELLVADEPFSGLDPIATEDVAAILRELAAAGMGILFSSHQLDLVEDICEDVVIIDHGRVVMAGVVDVLKAASGWRRLDVEVGGRSWVPELSGIRTTEGPDGRARTLVDASIDVQAILSMAQTAGDVTRFTLEPPSLSDLFREAVLGGEGAP